MLKYSNKNFPFKILNFVINYSVSLILKVDEIAPNDKLSPCLLHQSAHIIIILPNFRSPQVQAMIEQIWRGSIFGVLSFIACSIVRLN